MALYLQRRGCSHFSEFSLMPHLVTVERSYIMPVQELFKKEILENCRKFFLNEVLSEEIGWYKQDVAN